jgi:hypothetical protein
VDQARLVSDELNEGERFVRRLHESPPVSAAFWLKTPDDSPWYLYIAPEALAGDDLYSAYRLVNEVGAESPFPHFDPFLVKLIPGDDPLAVAAIQAIRRSAPSRVTRVTSPWFGGRYVEGAYVYSPSAFAAVASGSPPP